MSIAKQLWIDNINNSSNNSIQFNGYLIKCRLASTSTCYKASTKAQIQTTSNTNTQKQNINPVKQTNMTEKKQSSKRRNRAKTQTCKT